VSRGRPRLVPWLAVGAAAALAVVAVASGRPGAAPAEERAAVQADATAVLEVASVPTNLNPHSAGGDTQATAEVGSAIWPQAYQVGPGLAIEPDTAVVTSAEVVSLSPQTVVYHLNPRAVWSDGVPIRSDAFSYLWHEELLHQSTAIGASTSGYQDIASVTGSHGGTTVTVVFRTPDAAWTSLFDDLLPPQVGRQVGWADGFDAAHLHQLVFGGPWIVSSWVPGQRLELSRNPRWWGPRPTLAHIVLQTEGSADQAVAALAGGHAQAVALPGATLGLLDAVSSLPGVRSSTVSGATMVQVAFNTRLAPLDAVAFRQAVAHLIDPTAIVDDLVAPLDPAATVDGSFLYANGQAGYADDGAAYATRDPSAADRLLASAGVTFTSHGVATLAHQPVELTLAWAAGDPWSALVAPVVAASLEAAGIGVESEPLDTANLDGSLPVEGPWDLAIVEVPAQAAVSALAPEYSASIGPQDRHGIVDWSGYDSPTVDSLFIRAAGQLNVMTAQATYQQVDTDLWSALPALPLFVEPQVVAWSASLSGLTPDPGGDGLLWQSTDLAMVPVAGGAGRLAAANHRQRVDVRHLPVAADRRSAARHGQPHGDSSAGDRAGSGRPLHQGAADLKARASR